MQSNFPLKEFYSRIYRRYDLVNRLFTLGMDVHWRKVTARECLADEPARVLDLCCGTGDLGIQIRKFSPDKPEVLGYDFNNDMLSLAKKKAGNKALSPISFQQGDASSMPFEKDSFDAITIGFGFRNLTYKNSNADKHVREINRVLKPGGHLLILESAVPTNRVVRFFYNIYLRLFLIPLGSLISGNRRAYRYLALSSANYYNLKEVGDLLAKQNLHVTKVKRFFMGAANLVKAQKIT